MSSNRVKVAVAGVAVVVVIGVLATLGPAIVESIRHPRDEKAFAAYLHQYFPGWAASDRPGTPERDRQWVEQHPEAVLAEGEAACSWLAAQPTVPDLVPSGSATVGTMAGRYMAATAGTTPVDVDERSRYMIVVGAWAYLCHGAREARTSPASTYDD